MLRFTRPCEAVVCMASSIIRGGIWNLSIMKIVAELIPSCSATRDWLPSLSVRAARMYSFSRSASDRTPSLPSTGLGAIAIVLAARLVDAESGARKMGPFLYLFVAAMLIALFVAIIVQPDSSLFGVPK